MAQPKQPIIQESKNFNLLTSIWIVPMIAFLISIWLIYQHYSRLGPEIKIVFANSSGLASGQSIIKYRDVPVGKITQIELQGNGDGVIVTARMSKGADKYINDTTHFWVVKPEVGYGGVSGLDTLISGSYIAMAAKKSDVTRDEFVGLDRPYRDLDSGEYFLLHTMSTASIKVGTPINYRNNKVGQIEHIVLSNDGKSTDIVIFVEKKFTHLINSTTKFWLQSLLSIGLNGGKLDVDIAPILSHLVYGGISFETKLDKNYPRVHSNYFFRLYDNRNEAETKKIGKGISDMHPFIFDFSGKISGLRAGASIRYKGFDVGEVESVDFHYDSVQHTMVGKVVGGIDLSMFMDANKSGFENLKLAVEDGMRAQLKSTNPLLDILYIDLIFPKDTALTTLVDDKPEGTKFPTIDMSSGNLKSSITQFTEKLNNLKLDVLLASATKLMTALTEATGSLKSAVNENSNPLSEMLSTITKTSKNLDNTLKNIDVITKKESIKEMPEKLDKAIIELSKTLKTTKRVLNGYRSNSLFGKRVTEMLKEINKSSEETKRLLRKINKKPNSLIFGD